MHRFEVIREPYGWSVRVSPTTTTLFRSRSVAIQEAHNLRDALRRHGVSAEVVVDADELDGEMRSAPQWLASPARIPRAAAADL